MADDEKFDVIIVGAGPSGSACAYTLAKAGKTVLLIERGDTPGCKNVTGGRLYTYALDMLDKDLWQEADLERKVAHEQIVLLDKERSVNIDYYDSSFNEDGKSPMSFTVLRAHFDEWLAGKAEEMGAMLVCGIKVDDLIEKDGKIVGVSAGDDEMYADIVIAADGVNSFMAQKAGLIGDIEANHMGIGVKEVIELPSKTIEQRFNLKEGEGTAKLVLGCTEGIHGGGFLYTNKESISLGCVFTPEEVQRKLKSVHEIFQDFKMHPSIYPLVEGGKTIEYGAHLVTEAGYRGIHKKLYREGLLMIGDAAGFVINLGYTIRGIDCAILSGIAAARAIINSDSTTSVGPEYLNELENIKVLPIMKKLDGFFDVLETPWIYDKIPNFATDVFSSLFTVNGDIPKSIIKNIVKLFKKNDLSIWQLIKFGIKGVRGL
ncbi:MAG: FAD-dependent oxidoreductase [Dehalobacterium sp.]